MAAIRRDAKVLLESLRLKSSPEVVPRGRGRHIDNLIDAWRRSPEWRALRPSTQEGYAFHTVRVLAWSEERNNPDPTLMTQPAVLSFLSHFSDNPTTKSATARVLALIMQQAVALGWRTDNPVRGIRIKVPKSKATIWEQADVDHYAAAARTLGLHSIALVVLLMWEIGQRLTDVRAFRSGSEYHPATGQFSFRQSKTDAPIIIEVSSALQTALKAVDGDGVLFRYERTGKSYSRHQLTHSFSEVRGYVVKAGGRALLLRQLRHSCVVQLARTGCTLPEIAAVTGHTLGSVTSILGTYLPRDSTVARNAQVKRGLVIET